MKQKTINILKKKNTKKVGILQNIKNFSIKSECNKKDLSINTDKILYGK